MCSSDQVAWEFFHGLAEVISCEEKQLNALEFHRYQDQNVLQVWPLQQLASTAVNCEKFVIDMIELESAGSNEPLVQMAGSVCLASQKLRHLTISKSFTSAESGLAFLKQLVASNLTTLEHIDFSGFVSIVPNDWFKGQQEPIDLLVTVLKR